MSDPKDITDWAKLQQLLKANENANGADRKIDEDELFKHLRSRVKGQDPVLKDLARLVRLQFSMKQHSRPLCNLLFLGPTGTGKTELAKALAEYLYNDEKSILRFDCSELNSSIAKDRLIGVPTGYVGADQGGHLTRPMISNPKRVVLFDEIEKAYNGVFDLFLQMMGEGRLTEQGSGQVADFTKAIIILTSNAQAEKIADIRAQLKDYHEAMNAIKGHLADTNTFRVEILGRIDKVYIFEKLSGDVVAEVALLKISKLAASFGLTISFVAPELIMKALEANQKVSRFGMRELERIIFDLFAEHFVNARDKGKKSVELSYGSDGKVVLK